VAVLFLLTTEWATPLYRHYLKHPTLFLILLFTVACLLLTRILIKNQVWGKAWAVSGGTIAGVALFFVPIVIIYQAWV
jgi:hypothetical protein